MTDYFGIVALVLTCALWMLFGYWVWGMKKFMDSSRKRSFDFDQRINRQGANMLTPTTLHAELDAISRNAEARSRLVGLALADRIDALSARLDAVELACGVREKPKTMGGRSE